MRERLPDRKEKPWWGGEQKKVSTEVEVIVSSLGVRVQVPFSSVMRAGSVYGYAQLAPTK